MKKKLGKIKKRLTLIKDPDDSTPSMQEEVLNANLKLGLGVGTLLFILFVIQDIQKGLWVTLIFSSLLYAWLVLLTFGRRISYRVRTVSWLMILYLPAVVGFLVNGFGADVGLYLLVVVAMTTLFFGFRYGLLAILGCTITILIIGFLILEGFITPPVVRPQTDFLLWLIGLLTFTIMGLFLVVSITTQTDHLKRSRNAHSQAAHELSQALAELKKKEEIFRSMIENSTDIIINISEAGTILYGSPSIKYILEYPPEELIGKNVSEFIHPDDKPNLQELTSKGSWPDQIKSLESRARHADGSWRTLEIRGKKASLQEGPSLILNCRDITAQKMAVEALSAADQLKQKAFANLNDAIIIIEARSNKVLECNQAACQMFGYSRQELIDHTMEFLHISPEALDQFTREFSKLVEHKGLMSHFEFQMKRKDGTIFPTDHSIIPLEDPKGELTGWVGIIQDITIRKLVEKISVWELEQQKQQAETALARSESKFQHLFSGMMDAFFSTDMEGKIQDFNPVFSRMLGYEPDELMGRTRISLLAEKWHDLERKVIADEVLARGHSDVHEKEMVRKNGENIPVELRTFTITNERGEQVGMWSIVRDISSRKKVETNLQRSEAMYRTLAEAAQDMIFIIDVQDHVQYVNSYAASAYGIPPEEMIGQPRAKFFPSTDGKRQEFSLRQVAQTGQPFYTETQTTFPQEIVWLSTWLVPMKNQNGEITGMLGVSRDITERKMTEQKLQRSEEMYRTLAEAAQDVIYIIDEDDKVLYVNAHGASIFKAKPEEIIGQPWTRYFDPAIHAQQKENLHKVFSSKKPLYVETDNHFPSGLVWLSTWLVPLKNEQGKIIGTLGVSRDITDRKQIEERLFAAQHNLEQTVTRRTHQLVVSQERLRSLSRKIITAQEDERHIISRELHDEAGQALMSLKFSLDALKNESSLDQKVLQGTLNEMVTDIDQLMVQIRDLSHRLRPPLLDLGGIDLCLKELCWEYQKSANLQVIYKGEEILDLPDDVAISLYRLVQEALVNVQKHSRATRVEVILQNARGAITLSIEDNGKGMTRKDRKGIGLLGIEERLNILGGSMKISPRGGKGFKLVATIPWSGKLRKK